MKLLASSLELSGGCGLVSPSLLQEHLLERVCTPFGPLLRCCGLDDS